MILETKTHRIEPDITVIEVSGRLNLGNALQALEASIRRMMEQGTRKVVVNVAALEAIDSSGIGMLIGCHGQMEQLGGGFRVAGAQGAVAKVFEVVHLDRIAPLDESVSASCQALG
jgi:anti-sigma B factor antagonist